jgi:hypothetical protein
MLEHKNQGLQKTPFADNICGKPARRNGEPPNPTFTGSLSFLSLFFLLHCQGNGLSPVLRESNCEKPGQDPALSIQHLGLPADHVAKVGGQCLSAQCALHLQLGAHREWAGQAALNYNMLSLLLLYPLTPPLSFSLVIMFVLWEIILQGL